MKWSFYNGVCQSFTDQRYINKLYLLKAENQHKKQHFFSEIKDISKRISSRLVRSFKGRNELTPMLEEISEAYHKGYAFHEQAFRSNEQVRNWVLRSDYLDYSLPC